MKDARLLTARDIMTARVVTVPPDTGITDAIALLITRNISGVPVVTESGALVGILSEHDCLRVLARGEYNAEDFERTLNVAAFMSQPDHTIPPDLEIYSIAQAFFTHDVRRLPVIDGETLVGLVSRRDVLRGIQKMMREQHLPPPAKKREPKLYPSATGTSPAVIADRLK